MDYRTDKTVIKVMNVVNAFPPIDDTNSGRFWVERDGWIIDSEFDESSPIETGIDMFRIPADDITQNRMIALFDILIIINGYETRDEFLADVIIINGNNRNGKF